MPQEIMVLKCCECQKFQTHISKKAKKWICKICGAQQSVMKVYGQGTGKECRLHVQKLNAAKGEREAAENLILSNEYLHKYDDESEANASGAVNELVVIKPTTDGNNKWLSFVDELEPYPKNEEKVNCNPSQTLSTQHFQPLIKPLKRHLNNEDNITIRNYEQNKDFASYKQCTKEKRENVCNVFNEEQQQPITSQRNLNQTLQLRLQEPSIKKSKWCQFTVKDDDIK